MTSYYTRTALLPALLAPAITYVTHFV